MKRDDELHLEISEIDRAGLQHWARWLVTAMVVGLGTPSSAQIPVRVATFNIEVFDGDQPQFDAAVDVLQRIGADVVCVQEMTEQAAFDSLALAAGYDYFVLASTSGAIDSANRSGIMSMYPISSWYTATSVSLSGDPSAVDLTRNFVVAHIAVSGAEGELVVTSNHWKAGTEDVDEFRRSVESLRAMQILETYDGQVTPFLMTGDMNDDVSDPADTPAVFFSLPSGLPVSFELGSDLSLPINNTVFNPLINGTGPQNLVAVYAEQLDGGDATHENGRRIDYIWYSDAVTAIAGEVYDSADEDEVGGLPKDGEPLGSGVSALASDHRPVFADIEIPALADVTGACCLSGGVCDESLVESECEGADGTFYGIGTSCSDPLDPPCFDDSAVFVINEVLVSHDGTDDQEFVELFGPPNAGLSGLSLVVIEGETLSKGIVDLLVNLDGHALDEDGYFTLGAAAGAPDLVLGTSSVFEDGTQTLLLVREISVSQGNDLDTNNDGVADVTVGTILDAVGVADGGLGSSDFLYFSAPAIGPKDGLLPAGAARVPNGADNDDPADWQYLSPFLDGSDGLLPITPGTSNPSPPMCDGDVNLDFVVDPLDVGAVLSRLGLPPLPPNDVYDVNDDGTIDPLDAGYVAARFGECP